MASLPIAAGGLRLLAASICAPRPGMRPHRQPPASCQLCSGRLLLGSAPGRTPAAGPLGRTRLALLGCARPVVMLLGSLTTPPQSAAARRAEHLAVLTAAAYCAWTLGRLGPRRAYKKVAGLLLGGLTAIPGVGGLVDAAVADELADIEREMHGDGDPDAHLAIPAKGLGAAAVMEKAREQKDLQTGYTSGKKWGGVYHEEGELTQLQAEAWAMFNSSNLLYPDVFPGTRKFEAELVAMTLHMLHGGSSGEGSQPPPAVGLLSSGGTESILLAVLAYREQGRARGIERPEILAAISAHPALTKACHYFGVRLTKLPICERTMQLRPEVAEAAICADTVAIYSSAPRCAPCGRCVSIVLDKNRGYISESQSKWPAKKDATTAAPPCGRHQYPPPGVIMPPEARARAWCTA
jgi:hypothetical protein